VTPHSVEIDNC